MTSELTFKYKDGAFILEPLEPIAGIPRVDLSGAPPEDLKVDIGETIRKTVASPFGIPELTVSTPEEIASRAYAETRYMQDIEFDPPTNSLLQKIFLDWMQRPNFVMAGVFRTEVEKGKGVLLERLMKADEELASKYPQLTPAVRDAMAAEQVRESSYGIGAMFKQAFAHPFTPLLPPWGGEVKDPITAAGAAVIDLVLKKDTDGAAAVRAGMSGRDKSMFGDVLAEEGLPRILGLILDLGLDPINYLPWGLMVKGAAKGVGKLPGVSAAVKAIKEADIVTSMVHLFEPFYKFPKGYKNFEGFARRRATAQDISIFDDLAKAFKGIHGNKEKVAKTMLYVKQHPGSFSKISMANQEMVVKQFNTIDRLGVKLYMGKYITRQGLMKWRKSYMYGFYPQYTKQLSGNLPPSMFQKTAKASFARPKQFANVDEVKTFIKNLDLLKQADSVDDAAEMAKMFRDPADVAKAKAVPKQMVASDIFDSPLQKAATDGKSIYINPAVKFKTVAEIDSWFKTYKGSLPYKPLTRARQILRNTEEGAVLHEMGHVFSASIKKTPFSVKLQRIINTLYNQEEVAVRAGKAIGRPPLLSTGIERGILNAASEEIPMQFALYKRFPALQKKYFPEVYNLFVKNKALVSAKTLPVVRLPIKATPVADTPGSIETAIKMMNNMDEVTGYVKALQTSHTPMENFFALSYKYQTEAAHLFNRDKFLKQVTAQFGKKVPNIFDAGKVPKGSKLVFPKGQLRFYPGGKYVDDLVDSFFKTGKEGDEFVELTSNVKEFLLKLTKASGRQVSVSKKVKAFFMPELIADRLNKMSSLTWGDPATAAVFKYFDGWHTIWKGMATAMRLPFHLRNMYSNIFLLYVADVNPALIPRRMQQFSALKLSEHFPRLAPTIKTLKGKVLSNKQLTLRMKQDGVFYGWMGAETSSVWQTMNYFNKYGRLKTHLNPIEWGRRLGSAIENNARGALYLDRLIKGDDFQKAALSVFRGMYDYSPVARSAFELKYAKRAMSFYNWTRMNTPHMIHTMVTKPQKFANTGKVYRMLYDMAPETREERVYKRQYMNDYMWIKAPEGIRKLAGQTGALYYHLDLPLEGLSMLWDYQQMWNLITLEGLKPVIDVVRGQKDFPKIGMPIESFPGQKVPAPTFMALIPEVAQKALGIGSYVDSKSGKTILGISAKVRHVLYSMIPPLAEIAKMFPQPVDVETERAPWRILTYLTGVGFTPVDLKQQKWFWDKERRGKTSELIPFLLQEGRLPTKEETEDLREWGGLW